MLIYWGKRVLIAALTVLLISSLLRYLDITSASFSIGFNFTLMCWYTIAESQLKPALSASYFNAHPLEEGGQLYRRLGVERYRTFLIRVGWDTIRQQQTPIHRSLRSLLAYDRATRVAEVGHIMIGTIVLTVSGYVIVVHSVLEAFWLLVTNVFFNLYPVLLQRYVRPRLRRILAKSGYRVIAG